MNKYHYCLVSLLLHIFFLSNSYALDEVENGNTSATSQAVNLTSPKRIKGHLSPVADVDYYSFTAQAGNKFSAAVMTNASTSISTDTELRLFRADGTTLVEYDDDNGVLSSLSPSLSSVNLPVTGTYYLEVKDKSPAVEVRPYYLYLVLQTAAPTAENPALSTNILPSSKYVSGNITTAEESDYYSLPVNAGDTIFASLDLDPERNNTNFAGQLVFVHPGATFAVPSFDDPGSGDGSPDSEAGFITVKNSGTLLVGTQLSATGVALGNYRLQVAVFPKENELNCQTYSVNNSVLNIPVAPGITDSVLSIANARRIGSLSVNLNLTHANMPDLDVSLISPAGNEVVLFTDIGSSQEAGMNLTLNDEAAIPVGSFSIVDNLIFQPEGGEESGRLSWFSGMELQGNWTLRIRDDAAGGGGTLNAWGLTVCDRPEVGLCGPGKVEATIYTTDFEINDSGFTHSGTQDEWQYGLPSLYPIASCYSGSSCWKTDLDNTYNASSAQTLQSPSVNLSNYLPPFKVSWAHQYQLEDANFDQYIVEAEDENDPLNKLEIFRHRDGDMFATLGNPAATIPQSAGWGVLTKEFSSLNTDNVRFNFKLLSDISGEYAGVAIDDLTVFGCLSDADNDGTADINDSCPADPAKTLPGVCGCGQADLDSDNDGTFDCLDSCASDPLKILPGICGCGVSDADSDEDSVVDCQESCDLDPLKTQPGICGCGISDTNQDADSDATPDCIDQCASDPFKINPGICGCGVSDIDTDQDGLADCQDLCPLDSLKTAPGFCGCGVADADLNLNGILDCQYNPELKDQLLKLTKAVKKLKLTISNKKKLKILKNNVKVQLQTVTAFITQNANQLSLTAGTNLVKLVKAVNKRVKRTLKIADTLITDKKQANKAIKVLNKTIL